MAVDKLIQYQYIKEKFLKNTSTSKAMVPYVPKSTALTIYNPNAQKLPMYKPTRMENISNYFASQLKKESQAIVDMPREIGRKVGSFGRKMYSPFRPVVSKAAQTRPIAAIQRSLRKGNPLLRGAKALRRTVKSIPGPVRKAGLAGGLIAGATAMLGLAVMKGAMNQSREIVYERYMQDQAVGKNILNNTRMGLAAGTSRMQNMGSTIGLSNALSRTRHG